MVRLNLLVMGFLLANAASAHTELTSSVPAAGAPVSGPVAEIVLMFNDGVRLTAVALADASGAEKTLGALPKDTAERFAIAVEAPLPPGEYTITWRAVGADTHVVSGQIPFSVGPKARGP